MTQHRLQFRPCLEAFEDRLCLSSTTVLPISAFLAEQGHDSIFTPPVPDEVNFFNSAFDPGATGSDPNRVIQLDYTGQAAQYLLHHGGPDLHTSVTGLVTETPMGNSGLMDVSVNLEAQNALTWVANMANADLSQIDATNTAPLELGYRAQELLDNPHLTPALSNVQFQITWQEQTGAPLPDLPRLFENYALYAPPGFAFERINVQSWGAGTIRSGATVGTPGQTAIVSTWQVADLTNPNLPGNVNPNDGFWQEPVDILPVASATTHVAYLNGTLFVTDTSNGNDHVQVSPAANGGTSVSSNLGNGTFANVTRVVVTLGGGNNNVQIGNLPGATVDVVAFDGNNNISVGNTGKLSIHVGGGNNNISAGTTTLAAQFVCVGGNGNNNINVTSANAAEILVAGNGNNHISAKGSGDFIEVLGNGNNHIVDTGTNDLVWLGGDGNNDIDNQGLGSSTVILAGTGHNHIRGH
jgi:hypothetical protein